MRMEMTQFGREVWILAAKRGIKTQSGLARTLGVTHDVVRNYLRGRTSVPHGFLHVLDRRLELDTREKDQIAQAFAWGER